MRPRLLVLTDRSQLPLGRGLLRTVRECVVAGLEAVVVREHDLEPGPRSGLIEALVALDGLTVISSRLPDPRAHGVHAACNALFVDRPNRSDGVFERGTERYSWRGRSCHTRAEVLEAAGEGFDYATLSPYAGSASKPGYGPALGPVAFAGAWPIPVYALGGIDPSNAREAVEAGAHGVAVMGGVMRADQPAVVVRHLLKEVER